MYICIFVYSSKNSPIHPFIYSILYPFPTRPFVHSFICSSIHLLIRSECLTCTFRASCCSAHLSRAQVPALAGFSVRDRLLIYLLILFMHPFTHPPSIHPSIHLSIHPPLQLSFIHPFIQIQPSLTLFFLHLFVSVHPSIHPSIHPFIHPPIHPSIHLFIH